MIARIIFSGPLVGILLVIVGFVFHCYDKEAVAEKVAGWGFFLIVLWIFVVVPTAALIYIWTH